MTTPASQPPMESYEAAIESLLERIIRHGGFELRFTVRRCEPAEEAPEASKAVVDFEGPDADLLLEKNAALLDALEYLVLRAVRLDEERFGRISFDCKGWRQVRAEELKLTARMAAQQVIETGSALPLSPMNSRERRIIHLALKDETAVRTMSEGSGASRKVVIFPA